MKALTLWRPWDTAIFFLGKPVENRDWPPPASLVGQRIALHGGKTWDEEGVDTILRLAVRSGLDERLVKSRLAWAKRRPSLILGTVKLARVLRGAGDPLSTNPWFFGPVGWVCEDPIAFEEPVPCRGAQRLWTLPTDTEAQVLKQESAAVARAIAAVPGRRRG